MGERKMERIEEKREERGESWIRSTKTNYGSSLEVVSSGVPPQEVCVVC
jgi:hypothetical protein